MNDLISRQAAIDLISQHTFYDDYDGIDKCSLLDGLNDLPSAQPEPHYCRECKWSRCYINVDKHGKSETYWWCLNWDGGTDEEGYCYEWEKRTDE